MGLLDKFTKKAPQLKAQAQKLAAEHGDKVDDAIDKAADAADRATKGKHTAKIDQAADKAKDAADRLADEKQGPNEK